MSKLVVKKGYTLEVTSWENDGDNYRTLSATYQTKEEATLVRYMCSKLFACYHESEGSIGNLGDDDYEVGEGHIFNFILQHPQLLEMNNMKTPLSFKGKVLTFFREEGIKESNWYEWLPDYFETEGKLYVEQVADMVKNYHTDLLGCSEWYYSRVYESSELFYSDEDIYLETLD